MSKALFPMLLLLGACAPKEVGALQRMEAADAGNVYPEGPYGVQEGDTLANMTFAGYVNVTPEEGFVGDREYQESVSLADLRELGYRFLLFNVAAIWCVACQVEARELPGDFEKWAPIGGFIVSILKEDAVFNPATKTHLDQWVSLYQTNYTMLHDPGGEIDFILAPAALPLNVMIDLETMQIVRTRQGDDPEFFAFFEERLKQGQP